MIPQLTGVQQNCPFSGPCAENTCMKELIRELVTQTNRIQSAETKALCKGILLKLSVEKSRMS